MANQTYLGFEETLRTKLLWGFIAILYLPWIIALDRAPPGFYVDEAASAAHGICMSHFLKNFHGQTLPLFTASLGAGYTAPTYLYPLTLWTKIFGPSVYSLRLLSSLATIASLAILFVVVKKLHILKRPEWVLIIGATLPWAFHSSRIAWDPPMTILYLSTAIYFWSRPESKFSFVAAGIFSAFAMYNYPPVRITLPLFWICVLAYQIFRKEIALKKVVMFASSAFLTLLPLLSKTLDGSIQGRFNMLSIFGDFPANPVANKDIFARVFQLMLNMGSHLNPLNLFYFGDSNIRHSVPGLGLLGFHSLTIVVLALLFARTIRLNKKLILFGLLGIVFSFLSASLTWEGIPHYLRSIAAWPFFLLIIAHFADKLGLSIRPILLYLLVTLQFIYYIPIYFFDYPVRSGFWFGQHIQDQFESSGRPKEGYPEIGAFYQKVRLDMLSDIEIQYACKAGV